MRTRSSRRSAECARFYPMWLRRSRRVLLPAMLGLLLLAAPAGAITGTDDPTALANAGLRDGGLLSSAVFDVPANANATAVATEPIAGFPANGSDYLVLSSGDATLAPNASQDPYATAVNGGGTRGEAQDAVVLRLNLTIPTGANCLSLRFRFFSEEYPDFVGQGYNDGFLAEIDPSSPWTMTGHAIDAPDNFAFMPGGEFVSINSAPMTGPDAEGTTYGGGTPLLSAATSVTPGAHALVLSVWDDGDNSHDSTVFVDDILAFTASAGGCAEGAVTPPPDTTPPDTTITSDPGSSSGPSTSFSFAADESGSTFECRLDGGLWDACFAPDDLTGLGSGSHTFEVRAVDAASNVDATPASHTWTVDASPPDTTLSGGPSGATQSTSASFGFSSDEAGSTFECQLDSGPWTPCTDPDGQTGLADGDHTFSVRATDSLGNVDPTAATRAWSVDTAPPAAPVIELTSAPAALSSDADPAISFSGEPAATFECRLDGGAWSTCQSPHQLSALGDGPHTLQIRQIDPAGNTSGAAQHSWTVDTTAPGAPAILSGPPAETSDTTGRFALAGELGATIECRLDGGAWHVCPATFELDDLAMGEHLLQVRQTDSAGNLSPSAEHRWTIRRDVSAPPPALARVLTGSVGVHSRGSSIPVAVAEGGRVPTGCTVDAGSITSCTVVVRVGGRVVGRGVATFGSDGVRSGRVQVRLYPGMRARLAKTHRVIRATFAFRATVRGRTESISSSRTVVLAAQHQWILPSDGLFASTSARLGPKIHEYLRAIAPTLRSAKRIRCVGHTDSLGPRARNRRLGFRRARAVCRQLRHLGVRARLVAGSRGETRPRSTNGTSKGRRGNRRVALYVVR